MQRRVHARSSRSGNIRVVALAVFKQLDLLHVRGPVYLGVLDPTDDEEVDHQLGHQKKVLYDVSVLGLSQEGLDMVQQQAQRGEAYFAPVRGHARSEKIK